MVKLTDLHKPQPPDVDNVPMIMSLLAILKYIIDCYRLLTPIVLKSNQK